MKNDEKPRLFPEHFKVGVYSGSPRDFTKGKISMPRGGEDVLEYWYTDDPEESEYLDEDFQKNIEIRIEHLKREGWDPATQIFHATTQSHLDLGWMWRFRQGVAKAERTFEKVHRHFKLFKPFTFSGSQPACYQWVKYNSPDIWEMVLEDVKNGRHELQGGSWSEADGRMPSGEAWVRQRLYGQLFYARNFGKIANVSWFPDSFGYADNLPQLFAKSGAEGFMTSKLTSNKQTKWPFWAWIWEAPDGSQLLSYLSGNHNKLGPLGGFDVKQRDSEVRESYVKSFPLLKSGTTLIANYETDKPELQENLSDDQIPFIGCFFGEGDGGHGPQGVEMAVYRGFAEHGYVKWASTREIYQELAKYKDRLPVWKDELYYEYHRGSLTSQTLMKRMNRFFEWNLPALEGLHAIVTTISPNSLESFKEFYNNEDDQIPTTTNPIEQIWQNVLLMQFHDVLPGTSLPEVYDECYEMWYQDKSLFERLKKEAMEGLFSALELKGLKSETISLDKYKENLIIQPMLLINATGASGEQIIEIQEDFLDKFIPIFTLSSNSSQIEMKPIQFIESEIFCSELDKKLGRYIFNSHMSSWSCKLDWVIGYKDNYSDYRSRGKMVELQMVLSDKKGESDYSVIEEEKHFILKSPEQVLSINKETGLLDSLVFKGTNILKNPSGLRLYTDEGTREPSWNLMPEWWNNPKEVSTTSSKVELFEHGPVQWTVRVKSTMGTNSEAIIDYSISSGVVGFNIDIGIDFHETNTLVKYEFPLDIDAKYSTAETPYSTSTRTNKPAANHDIPRWEKWMHTFIAIEDEKSEANKRIGLAVLNQGKYGFDTLNDTLGISIMHGPPYVGVNVVAWVNDERKARDDKGLGQPPIFQDQGENLTRLRVIPYNGSWKEGNIHSDAHLFNSPISVFLPNHDITTDLEIDRADFGKIQEGLDDLKKYFNTKSSQWQFIKSSKPSVEVTVLKQAETLPDCLISEDNSLEKGNGLIFRVVNNINNKNEAEIQINSVLLNGASNIMEVDLLERKISNGILENIDLNDKEMYSLSLSLKPHEIRTFKILKD